MANWLRTSFVGNAYYRALQQHLIAPLQRSGMTANQVTLAGVGLAALVPTGFAVHPLAGLLLMAASGLADSLDGLMARQQNQVSSFGALLDSTLDRLSDFFYLTGFWVLLWSRPQRFAATLIMFAAVLLTLMISYVKARAEALGAECQVGIMDRAVRVLYLMAWALLIVVWPKHMAAIVWMGFAIYIGLTLMTVVQRIVHIRRQLAPGSPPLLK